MNQLREAALLGSDPVGARLQRAEQIHSGAVGSTTVPESTASVV
jgi:hypothetical protein